MNKKSFENVIQEEFMKELWKKNWNRKDLKAGDISGFTKWFMSESYKKGKI